MTYPTNTAVFAAMFGLIYAALTLWVVAGRMNMDIMHGDGGDPTLERRIRAHANFIEYVPFVLLILALFECAGGNAILIRTLLTILLVARLAHPFGMLAPKNSPRQYALRGIPFIATTLILIVTAACLLIQIA